ncbi:MAG: hypothetical protein H0T60_03895 [Acidobacteria bacterium]|nr:hypothetical protein [Acidobacteriota bacterium]
MKAAIIGTCLLFVVAFGGASASGQEPTTTGAGGASQVPGDARQSEARAPLAQVALAFDVAGREALYGRLRTQALAGTPEAPGRNVRLVLENRSQFFLTYVAGWATFYDSEGVRCGEGLWKLEAFAPNEQVEVDTPGLRLTCTPSTWRIVATTMLTRTGDVAKPPAGAPPPTETGTTTTGTVAQPSLVSEAGTSPVAATSTTTTTMASLPPLEINVNGKTIPIQLNNPLEIQVGKERVRIVVQPAP